jgi:hypothetical protein
MPNLAIALVAALQQGIAGSPGFTTPPQGDTAGYWQQRVRYEIVAMLDERAQRVRARGTLWYVNNSPDTLRELYFHQYLNAFRPGSRWSQVDEREGRVRFQTLEEPDFGYERFTTPVTVNDAPVVVEYPGAPDSTVARMALAVPLAPRDSVRVAFAWDARPSTFPRRQGRRGRHWDLAHWYPKIAVYDRGGWQANALQPAGEFYGEFGTYDVTLVVAEDQVLGATGVPVSGDPGWTRALRAGFTRSAAGAYGDVPLRTATAPPGYRAVRFFASDVHHFAWTASPNYRYEGGVYAHRLPGLRFPTWDTISVHVLYTPGDDSTWGGQRVLARTIGALRWLEAIFGAYPYPQITAHHRIDAGGGETPMMMMNGSPSQGLILHEGGHVYTYGALANNEWRSGWMDEGLTSYQTAWAQLLTPMERVHAGIVDRPAPRAGYRGLAVQMVLPRFEIVSVNQTALDLNRRAQPMGTTAHEFRDFDTYNDMIYDRAEVMFSQLRDLLGDSVFVEFLHDYYDRWALKHVDERALRASAERASGRDLGWFFDQWVRRTGVMDYRLRRASWSRDSTGGWTTLATVQRRGEYVHPVPVGVRTSDGWKLVPLVFPYDDQRVRIATREQPLEVRLDPFHVTWDWDRRNDVRRPAVRDAIDWPFLMQADRERTLSLWRPAVWYSLPGGVNVGFRQRLSYLGWLDETEVGGVYATGGDASARSRAQFWLHVANPYLPFLRRPAVGWRASAARLDDVLRTDVGWQRDRTSAHGSRLTDAVVTYAQTLSTALVPENWAQDAGAWSADLAIRSRVVQGPADGSYSFGEARGVLGATGLHAYGKLEGSAGVTSAMSERVRLSLRAYAGLADGRTPPQRSLYLSAEDPVATFGNHWWRPHQAILKQPDVHWLPLGGAALRGFHWGVASSGVVAMNGEASRRLGQLPRRLGDLEAWVDVFGDAGYTGDAVSPEGFLLDAGAGLQLRGRLFDQPVHLRLDVPAFVNRPGIAIDRRTGRSEQWGARWVITFNDIW